MVVVPPPMPPHSLKPLQDPSSVKSRSPWMASRPPAVIERLLPPIPGEVHQNQLRLPLDSIITLKLERPVEDSERSRGGAEVVETEEVGGGGEEAKGGRVEEELHRRVRVVNGEGRGRG